MLWGWEVDGTGWGSCAVVGCGTIDAEHFLSSTDVLTVWWNFIHCSYNSEKNFTFPCVTSFATLDRIFALVVLRFVFSVQLVANTVNRILTFVLFTTRAFPNFSPPQHSVSSVLWPLEALPITAVPRCLTFCTSSHIPRHSSLAYVNQHKDFIKFITCLLLTTIMGPQWLDFWWRGRCRVVSRIENWWSRGRWEIIWFVSVAIL
jgi:hypothetical protein